MHKTLRPMNNRQKKFLLPTSAGEAIRQHVAEHIAALTGGTLFRIEPEKPYPTEYTPCTEVAKAEKEADARPAIKRKSKIGSNMIRYSLAVPYGGGQLR